MGHPTGHKRGGTKLKNHKLRPAPAPADAASSKSKGKAKAAVEEDRAKDDSGYGEGPAEGAEEGEEEGEELRKEMRKEDRPLLGCVISISGIPDAEKMQQRTYAEALGARIEKALTTDVTHLVCERPDTRDSSASKYKVAVEHGKFVMHSNWLESLYRAYSSGEAVDVEDAFRAHRLPAFFNLEICIPPVSDDRRLVDLVEASGGRVVEGVTKSTSHLVIDDALAIGERPPANLVKSLSGPPRLESVWAEWLDDCAEAGVALPSKPYLFDVSTPRPGRRRRPSLPAATTSLAQLTKRDRLETAVVKKSNASKPILEADLSFANVPDRWSQPDPVAGPATTGSTKLSDMMDRTKKPAASSVVKKLSSVRSDKFASPSNASFSALASAPPSTTDQGDGKPAPPAADTFGGKTVSICGVNDPKGALVRAVTDFGGVVTRHHGRADYTVLQLVNPEEVPNGCNPVTINWLERCCYESRLVPPDSSWGFRPLRASLPIPNAESFKVTLAGFSSPEEKALSRILKQLGLEQVLYPRKSTFTHLIAGPGAESSSRVQTVRKWVAAGEKVEIVGVEWVKEVSGYEEVVASAVAEAPEPAPRKRRASDDKDPLAGCVLYLTKTIIGQARSAATDTCRRLGADVVSQFGPSVTHCLHASDKSNASSKDLKQARDSRCHIVHPVWLEECRRTRARADERAFPSTYRPGVALSYTVIPDGSPPHRDQVDASTSKGVAVDGEAGEDVMPPPLDLPTIASPKKASPLRRHPASFPSSEFDRDVNRPMVDEGPSLFNPSSSPRRQPPPQSFDPSPPALPPTPSSEPHAQHDDAHVEGRPEPGVQTQLHRLLDAAAVHDTSVPVTKSRRAPSARPIRPTRRPLDHPRGGGLSSTERTGVTRSLSDVSTVEGRVSSLAGFGLDDGGYQEEGQGLEESMRIGWADPAADAKREQILNRLTTSSRSQKRKVSDEAVEGGDGKVEEERETPARRTRPRLSH